MRIAFPSLALAALSLAPPTADAQSILFTEVSATAGVSWNDVDGGTQMSGGCALIDANRDGWLDIVLVGGVGAPGLFMNDGDGTFTDGSAGSGLVAPPEGQSLMGVAAGDYDDDGDVDLFISAKGKNRLYRNQGGVFSDVTDAAGVGDSRWGSSAAFGDYDEDGDLDLFVCNYVTVPSQPTPNLLYRNEGNGTFTNVAGVAGLDGNGTTLVATWTDYDGDGDIDLWVGNDLGLFLEPNQLFVNSGEIPGPDGAWGFFDLAPFVNADAMLYCMGVAAGDIDRDLDFDYHFTNIGPKLMLRNDGGSGFTDISVATGLQETFDPYQPTLNTTSWSNGFHDFDRDGWLDLYVSHGHVNAPAFVPTSQNAMNTPNQLHRHEGAALTFDNVSASAGVEDQQMGRGAAFGDLDNDGDMDVVQVAVSGSALIYRNDSPAPGGWMQIDARGRSGLKDASHLRIEAETSSFSLLRERNRNYGYLSSSTPIVQLGLGAESEVDHLLARWPFGVTQDLYHVPANTRQLLREPFLAFDDSSSAPAVVQEGNVALIQPVFRNHTDVDRTAYYFLEIRVGPVVAPGPILSLPLLAQSTATFDFPISVPIGATGGIPIDVELTWSVLDAGAGLDQWRNQITVTP